MLWDDKYLYLAYFCEDPDAWATFEKEDDPMWSEEVVEFFLLPLIPTADAGEVLKRGGILIIKHPVSQIYNPDPKSPADQVICHRQKSDRIHLKYRC